MAPLLFARDNFNMVLKLIFLLFVFAVFAEGVVVDVRQDDDDIPPGKTKLLVDTTASSTTPMTITAEPDSCNCDHRCTPRGDVDRSKKNTVEKEKQIDVRTSGDVQICARNQQKLGLADRTFASLCHMMCYNTCTKYAVRKATIWDDTELTIVVAQRENYYKVRDGSC
ncbi:uncharacterized protein LOC106650896 [Trichogramma pretiosum]|uniref:uncharacterized protein LOC106650896 n=1 Tax=Trichogramma pretiosum TaxID=7493 RepID=UPI0006C9472E|nr:uncharacterized protein LOC106650896 [Trichogramma pretiosum]